MKKILIVVLLASFSCKNSKNNTSQEVSIDSVIMEQIGSKFQRKDMGTLALCFTESKIPGEKRKSILVIDKSNGAILYGPVKLNADVDWYKEGQLIIKEYPEVIADKSSSDVSTYYFDILKKKKTSTIL